MNNKKIKMIVTDLDGTLLKKNKTTSEYTKEIFKECICRGLIVVFATARPERATRQWQIDKGIYVISNNGANITKNSNEVHSIPISESTKQAVLKSIVGDTNIVGLTAETGKLLYTRENPSAWPIRGEDGGWNPVMYDFIVPPKEQIYKLSIECGSPKVVSDILSEFLELHVFPNSGEYWYQITHKNATKLNAIIYLANMLGIEMKDIASFGDDFNDVAMLKGCGIGVAVDNAINEAKKVADYICDSNDNDGVARWLEENVL